jgi:HK97 family phage major capsid protein
MRAPYVNENTTWVMNNDTKAALRGLTYSSTDNRLLWSNDGRYALPAEDRLLGFPVKIDPFMPSITGANGYPVAVGDFKQGYMVIDRIGVRILRDPFSLKPYVLIYATKRVGGRISGDYNAIKLLKIASS